MGTETDYGFILLVSHAATIVWLFTLIRHFRGEYFYFFLFSNCANISGLILWALFSYNTNLVMLFFAFLLIPAVEKNLLKNSREKLIYLGTVTTVTLVFFPVNSPFVVVSLVLFIYLFLTLSFIRKIILSVAFSAEINLIHLLLLFYSLSIVVKIYNGLIGPGFGYYNFLVFQIINIIMGIIFTFVTPDTKVFKIKI